jgi:hypothetical protein
MLHHNAEKMSLAWQFVLKTKLDGTQRLVHSMHGCQHRIAMVAA